ncbi:MAG: hypothetical protein WCP65_08340 [Bacteroidota bacterium]
MKWDNLKLGLFIGLFAPVVGLFAFYLWKFRHALSFGEFIQYLGLERHLITGVISVSLVANAAFFTYFINTNKDHTAKGIFFVTIVYVVAAVILKLMYS